MKVNLSIEYDVDEHRETTCSINCPFLYRRQVCLLHKTRLKYDQIDRCIPCDDCMEIIRNMEK